MNKFLKLMWLFLPEAFASSTTIETFYGFIAISFYNFLCIIKCLSKLL